MTENFKEAILKACASAASINEILQANEKSNIGDLAEEILHLLTEIAKDNNEPSLEKAHYVDTKVLILSNLITIMKAKNPLVSDLLVADINNLGLEMKELILLTGK